MFDFLANLRPAEVAQFWMYFIGIFIIGLIIGWGARVLLTKISRDNFESEKKNFGDEKKQFDDEKAHFIDINDRYERLCRDLEKNEEYWLYKKTKMGDSHNIDPEDPSVMLSDGLKNNNKANDK